MTGQPYSDKAYDHVVEAVVQDPNDHAYVLRVLDAAHDREALGPDASVCERTLIDDITGKLETLPSNQLRSARWFARWIRQEYGL